VRFSHYSPEWDIELEFDYDPYEPPRSDCPGSDARCTLVAVYLFGGDITHLAMKDKEWVSDVEGEYIEKCAKEQCPDEGDRADYEYERARDWKLEERE